MQVQDPRLVDPAYANAQLTSVRPPSPDLVALDGEVSKLEEWAKYMADGPAVGEAESATEDSDGASSYAPPEEQEDGEIGAALDHLVAWAHVMADYEVLPDDQQAAETVQMAAG
eukprot:5332268-Amphidinium_carterae.1